MKKHVLLLLILTASITAYTQSYYPLIRPALVWQILDGDGSQICQLSGGGSFYFQGDTIISGYQYKIIREYSIIPVNTGPFCPPFMVDGSSSTIGGPFIREDTTAKKVFVYDQNSNSDVLLYDFNLNVGDTLNSTYAGQGSILIVDSVKTIVLLNGDLRKIFYLNNNEYYIESIGGSQGLQFPLVQALGFWKVPSCMSENNIFLWGTQCFGFVGINENNYLKPINVFPNPFSSSISFSSLYYDELQVIVYDLYSRVLLKQSISNSTVINTESLLSGIYSYEIFNQNVLLTKGRIVKQ